MPPGHRRILWIALVLVAAVGVLGGGTRWPDLLVAAALALTAGLSVLRQARRELETKGA